MKKIISMLMVVVMLLSLGSVSVFGAENPFKDVKDSDYFYNTVIWAIENGITNGTSETTFSPNDTCNHYQIITFLWRANGSPRVNDRSSWVPKGEYHTDAQHWLASEGIIDKFFAGQGPCSRISVVKYLYNLSGEKDYDISSAEKFNDLDDRTKVEKEAIAWAVDNKITSGISETEFAPEKTCTRAQIVTFLFRAYANR